MKALFTSLCLLSLGAYQLKAQISSDLSMRLQNALDSVCAVYKIKGTSAALLLPGVGIWKGANGVSTEGNPIQTNMALGMGSNTKTYIAVLLLKMQEQGLLDLDDTIGKWIQGYPNLNTHSTIRQCLNHQAGNREYLTNSINDSLLLNPNKIWNLEELLSFAGPANFSPGSSWNYSNTNYIIAGYVIEKVLKKSFAQGMKEMILAPNSWNNTFFFGETNAAPIPNQWTMNLNGVSLVNMNTYPINIINQLFSSASSAGAMMTTAEDNVKFWHELIKGNLISEQSKKELTQTIRLNSNSGYGLGIFRLNRLINGRTVYSHGGTFLGFINENIVDTLTGVSISVLTNQDSIGNNELLIGVIPALHKLVLNAYPTGLNQTNTAQSLSVYPNPCKDVLHIKLEGIAENTRFTISNMLGEKILEGHLNSETISTAGLANGIYNLHILSEETTQIMQRKIWVSH